MGQYTFSDRKKWINALSALLRLTIWQDNNAPPRLQDVGPPQQRPGHLRNHRQARRHHERTALPPHRYGLVSRDKRTVLCRTAQWAEGRHAMHHLLNGAALKAYGEWQELGSVQLLAAYLLPAQAPLPL